VGALDAPERWGWKMVVDDKNEPTQRETDAAELARAVWNTDNDLDSVQATLIAALREFDADTAEHCQATVPLSALVARRLGADPETVTVVERVAALHDIGKVGVPIALLLKPGPLAPEETALMHEHSEIGERIIAVVPPMAGIADAVRHTHERWDGGGYPDGIAGDVIPLASRITFACAAWHAMTSRRPYRLPLPRTEAMWELEVGAGGQFDPAVIGALLAVLSNGHERTA
jgi:HD-GYP domain-containing protein (c-di-GMP phosphodiesterase class II)